MSTNYKKLSVLVVEDDSDTANLLSSIISEQGFDVTLAASASQAIAKLRENYFPLIVSDIGLGGPDGLTLLPHTKVAERPTAIIFVTGQGSLGTAVQAIGDGAFEYLCKTENLREDLIPALERATKHLETFRHKRSPSATGEAPAKAIIGKAPVMVKLYRIIAKAALSKGNVLLMGESGTGKELVAHAIHDNGPWAAKPFVGVNCGALTETLLESELFGHVRGAFTGAIANKKGLFEEANEGTLFLDEIGDVSLPLQVKLLRAIQEGEIKPVGSAETRRVKVRVIAATHRDLEAQIREGKFREDLYYRLKVFLMQVPPLRERKEDIPELVEYFVSRLGSKTSPRVENVSDEVMQALLGYSWPGNVRELENAIERAISMACSSTLFASDLPAEITAKEAASSPLAAVPSPSKHQPAISLEQMESLHIAKTLELAHYNKSRAADILGIDRGTLYRKAMQYGIPLKAHKAVENKPMGAEQ